MSDRTSGVDVEMYLRIGYAVIRRSVAGDQDPGEACSAFHLRLARKLHLIDAGRNPVNYVSRIARSVVYLHKKGFSRRKLRDHSYYEVQDVVASEPGRREVLKPVLPRRPVPDVRPVWDNL